MQKGNVISDLQGDHEMNIIFMRIKIIGICDKSLLKTQLLLLVCDDGNVKCCSDWS